MASVEPRWQPRLFWQFQEDLYEDNSDLSLGKFQGARGGGNVFSPLDRASLYADNAGGQITHQCPEVLSHLA